MYFPKHSDMRKRNLIYLILGVFVYACTSLVLIGTKNTKVDMKTTPAFESDPNLNFEMFNKNDTTKKDTTYRSIND